MTVYIIRFRRSGTKKPWLFADAIDAPVASRSDARQFVDMDAARTHAEKLAAGMPRWSFGVETCDWIAPPAAWLVRFRAPGTTVWLYAAAVSGRGSHRIADAMLFDEAQGARDYAGAVRGMAAGLEVEAVAARVAAEDR